ncbi:MAG: Ribosomal silencing factor RsfS [Candidatus Anoxychlamydiales bacterium]|nr:Ribosomal silencing factor RsfS [Candidatus Anoxychlamydiales bacterium]
MKKDPKKTLDLIAQTIYDKKGENIIALDVKGISSITDYVIIASANVERHSQAIAKSVIDELKKIKERPSFIEGASDGDWIVIDYMNIMVHIFIPELRERYKLESLFSEAKIIDLNIKISNEV